MKALAQLLSQAHCGPRGCACSAGTPQCRRPRWQKSLWIPERASPLETMAPAASPLSACGLACFKIILAINKPACSTPHAIPACRVFHAEHLAFAGPLSYGQAMRPLKVSVEGFRKKRFPARAKKLTSSGDAPMENLLWREFGLDCALGMLW